jgi:hypothetical protein
VPVRHLRKLDSRRLWVCRLPRWQLLPLAGRQRGRLLHPVRRRRLLLRHRGNGPLRVFPLRGAEVPARTACELGVQLRLLPHWHLCWLWVGKLRRVLQHARKRRCLHGKRRDRLVPVGLPRPLLLQPGHGRVPALQYRRVSDRWAAAQLVRLIHRLVLLPLPRRQLLAARVDGLLCLHARRLRGGLLSTQLRTRAPT